MQQRPDDDKWVHLVPLEGHSSVGPPPGGPIICGTLFLFDLILLSFALNVTHFQCLFSISGYKKNNVFVHVVAQADPADL